jgi:hypothetical protein
MQKQRKAFTLAANIHYIRFTSPDGLGSTSAKITFLFNPNKPDNTDNITINNNSTRLSCLFIIIIIIIIIVVRIPGSHPGSSVSIPCTGISSSSSSVANVTECYGSIQINEQKYGRQLYGAVFS